MKKFLSLLICLSLIFTLGLNLSFAGTAANSVKLSGNSSVAAGEDITIDLIVDGAAWNQADITLTYETENYTYKDKSNLLSGAVFSENSGTIRIYTYGAAKDAGETTLVSLTFTAQTLAEDTETSFEFTSAKVDTAANAFSGNAADADTTDLDVTITAVTYDDDLDDGLTADDPPTKYQDYVVTINNYNDAAYSYTITATVDGTNVDFTQNGETITIDKSKVTGKVKITVQKTTIVSTSTSEYVGGYTLIVVYGGASEGYKYNGNTMFKTEAYDKEGDNGTAYSYIIKGNAPDDILALLSKANSDCTEIAKAATDVNNSSTTDISDAQAVYNIYSNADDTSLASYMAVYLRADNNGDKSVTQADTNAIINAFAGE